MNQSELVRMFDALKIATEIQTELGTYQVCYIHDSLFNNLDLSFLPTESDDRSVLVTKKKGDKPHERIGFTVGNFIKYYNRGTLKICVSTPAFP